VAFAIGPVAVRWYALAYVAGLVFAWWHVRRLAVDRPKAQRIMETKDVDDLLFWATLGVVLGGRLGYVLFYKPGHYLENPERSSSFGTAACRFTADSWA
jgi:phosphatidylglycerol---prolipoprotein diacylglyceryl transferase